MLYTAAQSRSIDARAIEQLGVQGFELMQRAAAFAVRELLQQWPHAAAVAVVTGRGNNAGDGYVLAALLMEAGVDVTVHQVGEAPESGDAARALAMARQRGIEPVPFVTLPAVDVVVDALLGTGACGPLRAPFEVAVAAINQHPAPVLALDLPTGLDADRGGPVGSPGSVVRADVTATFITRKLGQHTGLGLEVCGELRFDDLGAPASAYEPGASLLQMPTEQIALPVNTYKHARGHVLVVGGETHMGGAVLLAAEAAMRAGAGMVTVATRAEHRSAILSRRPEIMVADADDHDLLDNLLSRADAVVLGPGLGRSAWSSSLYNLVLERAPEALVIDADGLFFLPASAAGAMVVTPHAAEAAHLLGTDVGSVSADRPAAARALVERYGAVSVLKGAGTVICAGDEMAVCGRGTPSMATAGMGDVLAGVVAASLCRSAHDVFAAVSQAVLVHAIAAEAAVERVGRNLVAGDLFPELAKRC